MICKNCGAKIADGNSRCKKCNTPVNKPKAETKMEMHMYNAIFDRRLHVPSLLVGLAALALAFFTGYGGIALGIVGLILARRAREKYASATGHMFSFIALIVGAFMTLIIIANNINALNA